MCASDRRVAALLLLLLGVTACTALPAAAQQSREAELLRRLRQQVQQLQQEGAAQQQAAQAAQAERSALQQRLDAAEAQLKEQRRNAALRERAGDQARRELDAAAQRQAVLGERANALQATLGAERQATATQRAELQKSERLWLTLQDNYAGLASRHRTQAEGLQTCIARNDMLHALGLELLERYERKGVLDVLAVGEPVLQRSRVALENLVQDYRDKLDAPVLLAPR